MRAGAHERVYVLGTRGSRLARWQTEWVRGQLLAAWPGLRLEVRAFSSAGDRNPNQPLPEMGAPGVFTSELEQALRTGVIDLAVHSLKDLPVADTPGTALGAICARADARDVLVFARAGSLADLPAGARVGTCSVRRTAQLRALRPDLNLVAVRGNVDTRLAKVQRGEYDALVLAAAGLERLGLGAHIGQYLSLAEMLPAPGQAALAVQARADDAQSLARLRPLDDPDARAATTAERSFLQALGGGCTAPIAAYAQAASEGAGGTAAGATSELELTGLVLSADGRERASVKGCGAEPVALGQSLAQQALRAGAGAWL
jgi:hydroxymethylbilane synthase